MSNDRKITVSELDERCGRNTIYNVLGANISDKPQQSSIKKNPTSVRSLLLQHCSNNNDDSFILELFPYKLECLRKITTQDFPEELKSNINIEDDVIIFDNFIYFRNESDSVLFKMSVDFIGSRVIKKEENQDLVIENKNPIWCITPQEKISIDTLNVDPFHFFGPSLEDILGPESRRMPWDSLSEENRKSRLEKLPYLVSIVDSIDDNCPWFAATNFCLLELKSYGVLSGIQLSFFKDTLNFFSDDQNVAPSIDELLCIKFTKKELPLLSFLRELLTISDCIDKPHSNNKWCMLSNDHELHAMCLITLGFRQILHTIY